MVAVHKSDLTDARASGSTETQDDWFRSCEGSKQVTAFHIVPLKRSVCPFLLDYMELSANVRFHFPNRNGQTHEKETGSRGLNE